MSAKQPEEVNARLLTGLLVSWMINVFICPAVLAILYEKIGPGIFEGLAGSYTSTAREREIGKILLNFVFPISMTAILLIVLYFGYKLCKTSYMSSHRAGIVVIILMIFFAGLASLVVGAWKILTT